MNEMLQFNRELIENLVKNSAAVLRKALSENDYGILVRLGIDNETAKLLKDSYEKNELDLESLFLREANELIQISFNRERLRLLTARHNYQQLKETLISDLICANAPNSLLINEFGIHPRKIAQYRQKLGLKTYSSSPITDKQFDLIRDIYSKSIEKYSDELFKQSLVCIQINRETGLPIRSFYKEFFGES